MLKPVAVATFLLVSSCMAPQNHPSVLLLKGFTGSASGVVIADDWILTAKHTLPVSTADGLLCGEAVPHPLLDIALISCPGAKVRNLRLATVSPWKYAHLYTYSWQGGQHLLKTEGYQGAAQGVMSAPVIYGSSGGAVTNVYGELVGIITGVMLVGVQGGTGNYAVPHVGRYVVLDEAVRDWIGDTIK